MPAGPLGAASDQLLRLFAGHEAMPASEEELLGSTPALVPGQGLRQLLAYSDDGWQAEAAELRIEPGVGVSITVPAPVVHVLLSLDGCRPLAAVIDQAAS